MSQPSEQQQTSLKFSENVQRLQQSPSVADLKPPQRLIYALSRGTFDYYHEKMNETLFNQVGVMLFALVVGFAICFGAMYVSDRLLLGMSLVIGGWVRWGLYLMPALFVALILLARFAGQDSEVKLLRPSGGAVIGFELGRLDNVLNNAFQIGIVAFFGALVGMQTGLMYFTTEHAGVEMSGAWWDCFLFGIDNAMHGIFLDVCEMYKLSLCGHPDHHFFSASVFLGFRLGYDATFVLFLFFAYKRFAMRNFFQGYPRLDEGPAKLCDWLESVCSNENKWVRHFPDEFLFIMVLEEYQRGHLEMVRQLTRQFPGILVAKEVRQLFVDDQNNVIFCKG